MCDKNCKSELCENSCRARSKTNINDWNSDLMKAIISAWNANCSTEDVNHPDHLTIDFHNQAWMTLYNNTIAVYERNVSPLDVMSYMVNAMVESQ